MVSLKQSRAVPCLRLAPYAIVRRDVTSTASGATGRRPKPKGKPKARVSTRGQKRQKAGYPWRFLSKVRSVSQTICNPENQVTMIILKWFWNPKTFSVQTKSHHDISWLLHSLNRFLVMRRKTLQRKHRESCWRTKSRPDMFLISTPGLP